MALSLFNDPFMGDMTRQMTRAMQPFMDFGGTTGAMAPFGFGGRLQTPGMAYHPMDVVEHNDRFSIVADAPGMTPEDINVELNDNTLVITGSKSQEKETTDERQGVRVHRSERTFNRFSRSFTVPVDTKVDQITAKVENGVLTVDIPKAQREPQRAEAKRIRVMGGPETTTGRITGGAGTTTTGAASTGATAGAGAVSGGSA